MHACATCAVADPVSTDYEYDALGNRTRVDNLLRLTDTAVIAVEPRAAVPGDRVNIYGRNFPWQERATTFVMFGDTVTQPILMSERVITVEVPEGAATGELMVLIPGVDALDAGSFAVEGVAVSPLVAALVWNETASFTADLVGVTGDITWSVDGVPGGNDEVGTIDEFGFYTAPAPSPAAPLPFAFNVTADAGAYLGQVVVTSRATSEQSLAVNEWAAGTLAAGEEIARINIAAADAGAVASVWIDLPATLRASLTRGDTRVLESSIPGGDEFPPRWGRVPLVGQGDLSVWISGVSGGTIPPGDGDFELIVIPGEDDPDGDFLTTDIELANGLDPNRADTDGDGTIDADEDPDGDGLVNIREARFGTAFDLADTDFDGLSDFAEVTSSFDLDPLDPDTDDDGFADGEELPPSGPLLTDPTDPDDSPLDLITEFHTTTLVATGPISPDLFTEWHTTTLVASAPVGRDIIETWGGLVAVVQSNRPIFTRRDGQIETRSGPFAALGNFQGLLDRLGIPEDELPPEVREELLRRLEGDRGREQPSNED